MNPSIIILKLPKERRGDSAQAHKYNETALCILSLLPSGDSKGWSGFLYIIPEHLMFPMKNMEILKARSFSPM